MKKLALLTALLPMQLGCLAKRLAVPVEDHFIQTMTIVHGCMDGDYGEPCPEDMIEDLKMMEQQACALDAIIKSEPSDRCEAQDD